jgi:hypothetical protein
VLVTADAEDTTACRAGSLDLQQPLSSSLQQNSSIPEEENLDITGTVLNEPKCLNQHEAMNQNGQ